MYTQFDPFIVLIRENEHILRQIPMGILLAHVVRIYLSALCVLGLFRMLHVSIIIIELKWVVESRKILFYLIQLMESVECVSNASKIDRILKIHTQITLCFKNGRLHYMIVLYSLTVGCTILVLFNFITIRMYGMIPFLLYLIFPTVNILIVAIVHTVVPFAEDIETQDQELRTLLINNFCRKKSYPYLSRRVLGLTPNAIRLQAGVGETIFFYFKRSTKSAIYSGVFLYTINFLLATPVINNVEV